MAETIDDSSYHRRQEKKKVEMLVRNALEAQEAEKQRSRRFQDLAKILIVKKPTR